MIVKTEKIKKMSKILVTGGAGFLGSTLCRRLLELDNTVICYDNLSSGALDNIRDLLKNDRFTFRRDDVKWRCGVTCDQIYHLACPASPKFYQKDSVDTITTCVCGTINILDLAADNKAKILFASTSEVYGDPLETPQKESYRGNVDPYCLRSCYDEGKRAAETMCYVYKRDKNVASSVVRIFNSYGPRMRRDDGRVVSNFICRALENQPITVYGDGTQTRSFCYVDDTISGLIAAMETETDGAPINIGNPNEISMNELAKLIRTLCDSTSPIVYKDLPENDPKRRVPDIERAKSVLNWTPTVELIDGLNRTIEFFKGSVNA